MNSMLAYGLIDVLGSTGIIQAEGYAEIAMGIMELIPPFILVPRFVLTLRKVYARDLQGRRGSEIDTAFGLGSAVGRGAVASAIMFADAGENEGEVQGEEIQLEARETSSPGSSA